MKLSPLLHPDSTPEPDLFWLLTDTAPPQLVYGEVTGNSDGTLGLDLHTLGIPSCYLARYDNVSLDDALIGFGPEAYGTCPRCERFVARPTPCACPSVGI